jgi:starch synthase (maltosyl-transferring)
MNLDPQHVQPGWLELDLGALGIDPHAPSRMHELLTGVRDLWSGARNYVSFAPQRAPAHIFRLRRRVRSERDFDYFV